MAQIFISFRTTDEPGFAALLYRELLQAVGPHAVFFAGTGIRPGDDFELRLIENARKATTLLAVVGSRWLAASAPSGHGRAIDDPSDWVRREIREAFSRGARVIPILVENTERLTDADLPPDIDRLRRCQYLRLRHGDLLYDIKHIVDSLEFDAIPTRLWTM